MTRFGRRIVLRLTAAGAVIVNRPTAQANVSLTNAERARVEGAERPGVGISFALSALRRMALLSGAVAAIFCSANPAAPDAQEPGLIAYRDPMGRFAFSYPATFGQSSPGTNDGFGSRSAAIRFSTFSTQGVGGEAVLTVGPPFLDIQAAGGLYDEIAREVLPDNLRAAVLNYLPRLTSDNLCERIGRGSHIEVDAPFLLSLPVVQREAVVSIDRLGNVSPTVQQCVRMGDVVTFQKMASFMPGAPPRLVSGAVRFLDGDYSSFHLVRAVAPTDSQTLRQMQDVVASWRRLP